MTVAGFMVRDRATGLFRTKTGSYAKFGKIWRTFGHLKLHYVNYPGGVDRDDEIIVLRALSGTDLSVSLTRVMSEKELMLKALFQHDASQNDEYE